MFRPAYSEEGNVTELFFWSGEVLAKAYDRRTLPSVRRALARSYALDLSAQAKDLKKKINRCSPTPICLPDGRVFVPLKMRRPRITGDSTYGYADTAYIRSVQQTGVQVNLLLEGGEEVALFTSAATAMNIINLGKTMTGNFAPPAENEREKIIAALSLLVDKLYRIEELSRGC